MKTFSHLEDYVDYQRGCETLNKDLYLKCEILAQEQQDSIE